ncbi:MAG: DUF1801 domain-containing protein [Rhodanobacteraceae bacterium]
MPHTPRFLADPPGKPNPEVDTLLASLDHPCAAEIEVVRRIILAAVPCVRESVKWNAPSFATTEHFATFHLRTKSGIQVVLHLGAKPRPDSGLRAAVADPAGLLQWRGPDRATVSFRDLADVEAKAAAFTPIVRQWVAFVR